MVKYDNYINNPDYYIQLEKQTGKKYLSSFAPRQTSISCFNFPDPYNLQPIKETPTYQGINLCLPKHANKVPKQITLNEWQIIIQPVNQEPPTIIKGRTVYEHRLNIRQVITSIILFINGLIFVMGVYYLIANPLRSKPIPWKKVIIIWITAIFFYLFFYELPQSFF